MCISEMSKRKKTNTHILCCKDDRRRFFPICPCHITNTFKLPIVSQRWPYRMTNKSFRIAIFYAYRAKEMASVVALVTKKTINKFAFYPSAFNIFFFFRSLAQLKRSLPLANMLEKKYRLT